MCEMPSNSWGVSSMKWILDDLVNKCRYESDSPSGLIEWLRKNSWNFEPTILDFKISHARRVEVRGVKLLFWDSLSFLQALESAGLVRLHQEGENEQKK